MIYNITTMDKIDKRKLMDIYREGNMENTDYFYPEIADKEQAVAKVESDFLKYIETDFLSSSGNVYWVLEENAVWVSALRLYRVDNALYYIEALETHPDFRRQGHAKRYALETAKEANVNISFEVCDVLEIDMDKYGEYFDVVFMEGGVLHYFHDIDEFMRIMYHLLKDNGKLICSDFHPFTKIADILNLEQNTMDYFSTDVFEGEMAHARFFDEETRKRMPKCSYRKYTISEILNSIIGNGFTLRRFDEHPSWADKKVTGEFTAVAVK